MLLPEVPRAIQRVQFE